VTVRVVVDQGGIDEVMSLLEKRVTKTVIQMSNAAKRLAPVDTGRLRSSITYEVQTEQGVGGQVIRARVGTNVRYAPYLELGTSRMVARPYLRPTLDIARREFSR
jgi:HK97 gp10 family phage protein